MLRIDPNALYSLSELEEELRGIVELPTLLDRLGLRQKRIFRNGVFGFEILEAARRAEPFTSASQVAPCIDMTPKGGKNRSDAAPVRRLGARDLED